MNGDKHRIEEGEMPEGRGACFFDQARICNSDCMAFLPSPPEGTAYVGENWAYCHLLVNADRCGRHLAIIANELGTLRRLFVDAKADEARGYSGSVDPK